MPPLTLPLQGLFQSSMRSEVLMAASVGLTALVLANAWMQRQQFYPSVVYITKSNPSMAVIYLQVGQSQAMGFWA